MGLIMEDTRSLDRSTFGVWNVRFRFWGLGIMKGLRV